MRPAWQIRPVSATTFILTKYEHEISHLSKLQYVSNNFQAYALLHCKYIAGGGGVVHMHYGAASRPLADQLWSELLFNKRLII